jgi:hypothetical protein
MSTEVRTLLRAVMRISYLTLGFWRFVRITVFGTYQVASSIMRRTFGRVLGLLCVKWKLHHTVVFHRLRLVRVCFVYENVVACGEF